MRTENLAIVFTDIQGFTERTSHQTHAENERLLHLHERLLVPVFRAFGGVVRKSIGDAYLVTFTAPTQAVLCGTAIQDRLHAFNASAPEADRLRVRVVVHLGEVRVERHDVFGEPVNVASRIEGVAEAGEVTFSEAVYLVMNRAEVPVEPLGPVTLKGVAEAVNLYRVPHAPYRVRAEAPDAEVGDLPFGGLALGRVALPPASLADLDAPSGTARFTELLPKRRSLPDLKGLAPIVVGAALVAGAAALFFHLRAPEGIRLIEAGKLDQAAKVIDALPDGAERSLQVGRLMAARGRDGDAVDDYVDAAARDPGRAGDALDALRDLAEHGSCGTKVQVARAVGDIGDPAGESLLDDLADAKAQKASGLGGILGLKCDPARAAAAARARLKDH